MEFYDYPSESSFSAPPARTAGLALNNGSFEPGGYRALLERFIVGEIQRRAEAEPDHDWRLTLYPSHGTATFQRDDKDAWRQIDFESLPAVQLPLPAAWVIGQALRPPETGSSLPLRQSGADGAALHWGRDR